MKNVVIIGGGAAGLIAAIYASKKNKVTLIERNNCLGKKILITGNGRCNYYNENQNISKYHSENEEFIKNIINKNTNEEILTFFKSLGIIPKIKNGYYYPYSESALSIKDALLSELKNVNIKTNTLVTEIIKKDKFIINPKTDNIKADIVIITTGSKACPKTGSDGIGYEIAKNFGHHIIKPLPALVQLIGNKPYFKKWTGIRVDSIVKLYENDKFVKEEEGQLQLTDYGLSGICIFNLSQYVAKGLSKNKKEDIIINFMPWLKEDKMTWFENQIKLLKNKKISELLEGFLNYKLVNVLLEIAKIKPNILCKSLNNKEKENLINTLTKLKINITNTKTFNEAQVCSGGVPLNEINTETMESLKIKDLYFAGEILDVNGDCGGYNLTFAWTTGMIAGLTKGNNND